MASTTYLPGTKYEITDKKGLLTEEEISKLNNWYNQTVNTNNFLMSVLPLDDRLNEYLADGKYLNKSEYQNIVNKLSQANTVGTVDQTTGQYISETQLNKDNIIAAQSKRGPIPLKSVDYKIGFENKDAVDLTKNIKLTSKDFTTQKKETINPKTTTTTTKTTSKTGIPEGSNFGKYLDEGSLWKILK